jgi:putative phosphoesterase
MAPYRVGVVSDTHGHFPPHLRRLFRGVDRIVHAGDIDGPDILDELKTIAPVSAVRGNMDVGSWAARLPTSDIVDVADASLLVMHDLNHLDLDPRSAGIQMVISGHLHRASLKRSDGVWYLNPGSAAFPRGGTAATAAVVIVGPGVLQTNIVTL